MYPLVICYISENPPIFKNGKPSILIRAIYTKAMLNNQRVDDVYKQRHTSMRRLIYVKNDAKTSFHCIAILIVPVHPGLSPQKWKVDRWCKCHIIYIYYIYNIYIYIINIYICIYICIISNLSSSGSRKCQGCRQFGFQNVWRIGSWSARDPAPMTKECRIMFCTIWLRKYILRYFLSGFDYVW